MVWVCNSPSVLSGEEKSSAGRPLSPMCELTFWWDGSPAWCHIACCTLGLCSSSFSLLKLRLWVWVTVAGSGVRSDTWMSLVTRTVMDTVVPGGLSVWLLQSTSAPDDWGGLGMVWLDLGGSYGLMMFSWAIKKQHFYCTYLCTSVRMCTSHGTRGRERTVCMGGFSPSTRNQTQIIRFDGKHLYPHTSCGSQRQIFLSYRKHMQHKEWYLPCYV